MLLHLTFPFSHINIFYVRNQNTIGKEEDEQMFFFFFLVHQSKPNQTNTLLLYYIKIQYSTTNNNNNNKLYPTKEGHVSPCRPSAVPLSLCPMGRTIQKSFSEDLFVLEKEGIVLCLGGRGGGKSRSEGQQAIASDHKASDTRG